MDMGKNKKYSIYILECCDGSYILVLQVIYNIELMFIIQQGNIVLSILNQDALLNWFFRYQISNLVF